MSEREIIDCLTKALAMTQSHLEVATAEIERLRKSNDYYIGLLAKVGTGKIEEALGDE